MYKKIDLLWRFEHRDFVQVKEIEAKFHDFNNSPSQMYYELFHPETKEKKYITSNDKGSFEIEGHDYQYALAIIEQHDGYLFTKIEMTGEQTF